MIFVQNPDKLPALSVDHLIRKMVQDGQNDLHNVLSSWHLYL